MEIKLIVGLSAGILTAISSIPQIVKLIKEKKAENVSPLMFFVLLAGNSLWVYYGTILNDIPIIATNSFSALLDITMIILNYKYSSNR